MDLSNELLEKARAAKSAEELLSLAAENGVSLTAEEAKARFAQLTRGTSEGELADEELENVSGGSYCKDGRTYSDDLVDGKHYLITTGLNTCGLFKHEPGDTSGSQCMQCKYHEFGSGLTIYCRARWDGGDISTDR